MPLREFIKPFVPGFVRQAYRLGALVASKNFAFVDCYVPGHYYSPIPDMADVHNNRKAQPATTNENIPAVDLNEARQLRMVERFAAFYGELPFPERAAAGSRYYLDNGFFCYGDGVALYSMMRQFRPQRIVEVGSGFSSAAMLDVDDRFFGRTIDFTFVEPYPKRLYNLLGSDDRQRCKIIEKPVQDVPAETFAALDANDILFIDSSHVAKAHSDVLHLMFDVLPMLRPGVLVHFHDILWPFDYPLSWFDCGRAWNEVYLVRAFLQYNTAFEIVYFNSFMAARHAELLASKLPLALKTPSSPLSTHNASLWLRKTGSC